MNRLQANICLLCVTLCWSMEVVLYACIPEGIPSFATACVTSFVGAFLLFATFHRRALTALRSDGRRLTLGTASLAALSALYNTMFLCGLKSFDITSGAFTFCMTVVILPVVLLSFRRRIGLETLLSVVLVGVGIILALGPSLHGEQLPGLALMGGGCLMRAVFIVIMTEMAKKYDPLAIAIVLELFTGVFSLFGWLWQDPHLFFSLPLSRTLIAAWTIYSYFIEAIALGLNILALKHVTATNATVVYSLEIVFSIIWGVVLPASVVTPVHLTPTVVLGAVLVLCGSLAEIIDIRGKRAQQEGGK